MSKKNKNITIVGYYGYGSKNLTGQVIKIRSLCSAFTKYAPQIRYTIIDTQYLRKNPLRFMWMMIKYLPNAEKVIFFASKTGRKFMFPFFYSLKKLTNKEVYHDCIGGALDGEIDKRGKLSKYLNSFDGNWMENPTQVETLKGKGIKNSIYLPNFKFLTAIDGKEMSAFTYNKPYRFCIFCRVERMKGIEDALQAIHHVNSLSPRTAILDVYGLIEVGEEGWFEEMMVKYKDDFHYCGVANYNESTKVISSYLAMLFPTRYYTEGMPGTIIDAMFAGVPVIARRWKWCDNMLTHHYNSIVYDFNKPETLNEILWNVCQNPQTILEMKHNCVKESQKYGVEQNIQKILNEMHIN